MILALDVLVLTASERVHALGEGEASHEQRQERALRDEDLGEGRVIECVADIVRELRVEMRRDNGR